MPLASWEAAAQKCCQVLEHPSTGQCLKELPVSSRAATAQRTVCGRAVCPPSFSLQLSHLKIYPGCVSFGFFRVSTEAGRGHEVSVTWAAAVARWRTQRGGDTYLQARSRALMCAPHATVQKCLCRRNAFLPPHRPRASNPRVSDKKPYR